MKAFKENPMVTMLDCIRRVATLTRQIVENAEINTDEMIREIGQDIGRINEIVIVGSGSSNNAAVTAAAFGLIVSVPFVAVTS